MKVVLLVDSLAMPFFLCWDLFLGVLDLLDFLLFSPLLLSSAFSPGTELACQSSKLTQKIAQPKGGDQDEPVSRALLPHHSEQPVQRRAHAALVGTVVPPHPS